MAISATIKEKYHRRQALYWLGLAVAMLVAWLILWIASSAPTITKKDEIDKKNTNSTELPTHIESLGELDTVVPPIDFSTLIRDLRTYPAEFKDKKYFNAKKFTIQVMDVSQNDVIVNYLNTRNDRDRFAYFRYLDDNKNPRYILTYGKFDSMEQANATAHAVSFALPTSVQVNAVAMADYLSIIDDYERGDVIRDSSSRQPRQVRLQATRNEIPIQAATKADEMLANRSQEQARERASAIQRQENDGMMESKSAVRMPTASTPEENISFDDQPKPSQPKETVPAIINETPIQKPSPPEVIATPNVNTSKIPGSE